MRRADSALIERNMTNHPPADDVQVQMEKVREKFKAAGKALLAECPESRERSLALTNLEQALMWAIASLARPPLDSNGS